jgi:ubiquinone/menaquinone biosynthesis C-methylase UbiE
MIHSVPAADNKKPAVDVHTQQADEFAERYEVRSADPYADCFAYSRHRLASVMDGYLPESGGGKSLLDVGCGTGHHIKKLREAGYVVSGVDASEGMLAHARTNNPGVVIKQGDVDALPFPDASFDYVLSIEVLRYLENPQPSISEMARVLKPGGIALVTAAPKLNLNGYWPLNQITSRIRVGNLTQLRQHFTTSWNLRRQFHRAGFSVVTVHGIYIGPINWVGRLARPLLRSFLRRWEPIDSALTDRPILRDLSNMYLVRGERAR